MKAIKFAEPWKVACVDQEMPTPKEGEALIKIHCAAVCGSDIGAFRGTNGLVSYPRVIGHELSGEIVSIPDDPAQNPKGLKVGDRVAVDPYIYCGHCYACSIGRTNCCTSLKVLGVHVDGGMCEYFCHPANLLVKLPEGMSYEMGSLAEPLTIALHGIHRGSLKAGEYVAILGAGPIGLYAGMAAEAYGAHAIIIDIVQERLDFAKKMGVEYIINSKEVDAVEKVREITVGAVDEVELSRGFFNYTEKYTLQTSAIHCPARIAPQKAAEIRETAKVLYRALGCRGFARVDLFLTPWGEIVFNEVNTIPGFTPHSRYPAMMRAAGIPFRELVSRLIQLGAEL